MAFNRVHFSSLVTDVATPQALFDALNSEFGFTMDVCASADNAKCEVYMALSDSFSALARPWEGTCWMNPPYGRHIGKWLEKAFDSARLGATVVCLIPSRTDTRWWHKFVMRAEEIRFIKGRLKFGGMKQNCPFPSAIVVFRPPKVGV